MTLSKFSLVAGLIALAPMALGGCGSDSRRINNNNNNNNNGNPDATAQGNPDAIVNTPDLGVDLPDTGPMPNCDDNPSGCGMGQLRGAPPTCMCLPACLPGFTWTGAMCVMDMNADGGVPDMGMIAPDVDIPDVPVGDAPGQTDLGINDTGNGAPDGGVNPTDGGPNDGGVITDTGNIPDVGPVGLNEGDPCNPAFNDCQQRPGMTCQAIDQTGTMGVCMVTCDSAMNLPNSLNNPACTGRARSCFDLFNLGAANSRCFDSIEPYNEAETADRLDFCNPTFPNMARIPATAGAPTQTCVPLCTVETNPAVPLVLNCTPALPNCDPSRAFQDGNMPPNRFGVCTQPVGRGQFCEPFQGRSCTAPDTCWFGICREQFGTTCTSTTICSDPNERCHTFPVGTTTVTAAACHDPCDMFAAMPECPMGQQCTITATGTAPNQTAFGTCRASQGMVGQQGSCADPFGLGSNRFACDTGLVCATGTMGFTNATCLTICDPDNPAAVMCPGISNCNRAGIPFNEFGICF